MAIGARQWASQFTWDKMADQVLALLGAEAGRLAQSPNNRRTATDLSTVVRIPVDLIPDGEIPTFRETDLCNINDDDLVVLLRNTDTDTARHALRRAGFTTKRIVDERRTGICRASHRSGVARHSGLDDAGGARRPERRSLAG